jgi:hypothetical protein
MDVNKYRIVKNNFTDKQINIPLQLSWDYLGIEQSVDEYEKEIINEVIGFGRDFEVSRFSHEPISESVQKTDIKYQFYFYSGGSLNSVSNWKLDYRGEGFTTQDIYYFNNNFSNSFFKLDFYDNLDSKKQTNYITVILPTQQGAKINAIVQRTPVTIKIPDFILDFVGDKEGFFIYWLKKRNFLNINTFYMSAKFYNAETGAFTTFINTPQSSFGDKFSIDTLKYYYYKVVLDYDKKTYQVFDVVSGLRVGTTNPIKWYEYVNP